MQFGERLKVLRKRKGLSQQEVADRVGITLRAYAAYETKNIRPKNMKRYKKLADVLGCDINELLVEDSSKAVPIVAAGAGVLGYITAASLLALGVTPVTGSVEAITAGVLSYLAFSNKQKNQGFSYEDYAKEQNNIARQYMKTHKQFSTIALGIILSQLGKKGIKCQVDEVKNVASKGHIPDSYIKVDSQGIDEWWFVFWCAENRNNEQSMILDSGRAYMLFNRFCPTTPDPRRKASFVTDDEKMFDELCELKGKNSYRGNLTVILLDTDELTVLKEEHLSSFNIDDTEDKLPII